LGIFDQHDSAFTFFAPFSGEIGGLRLTAAILVLWHPSRHGCGLSKPTHIERCEKLLESKMIWNEIY
jgi:hypothetical protein